MNTGHNIYQLTDHLFRQDSGKMVSVLSRIFGIENLQTAEDIIQQTFLAAIENWSAKGIPNSPSDWLFMVARNKAIDIIRKNKHTVSYDFSDSERVLLTSEYTLTATMDGLWKEEMIKDDMLQMMFACCHPGLSAENQVTLILKTLCGLSTTGIARALLTTEDTVSKRLYRTKEFFRRNKVKLDIPPEAHLNERTNAVLNSIYLLFSEGYSLGTSGQVRNKELMSEAMMLGKLLTENNHTQLPGVFALMALMCFHAARSESRFTPEGEIILLPQQDRSRWDKDLIQLGNRYLGEAAFGGDITPYHLEAAIAFEHCVAKDFEHTNWEKILQLYEWLCNIAPSPVSELNKIVAVMQVHGPAAALTTMEEIPGRDKLESYYLYHALLGEIYARLGDDKQAIRCFETASSITPSETERNILLKKIAASAAN